MRTLFERNKINVSDHAGMGGLIIVVEPFLIEVHIKSSTIHKCVKSEMALLAIG